MSNFLKTYHALIEIIELMNNFLESNFQIKRFGILQLGRVEIERGTFNFKINNIDLNPAKIDEVYKSLPILLQAFRKILAMKELEIQNTKEKLDKLEEVLAPQLITDALKGGEGSDE